MPTKLMARSDVRVNVGKPSDEVLSGTELQARLEKYTNRQLLELLRTFDITFKDRSKANKAALVRNLLENVGPESIPQKRFLAELEAFSLPGERKRRITKEDLDELQNLLMSRIETVARSQDRISERILDELLITRDNQGRLNRELSQIAEKQSFSNAPSAKSLLRALRKAATKPRRPEDFDAMISFLSEEGFMVEEVAKTVSMLSGLDSTLSLLRRLSWTESTDFFYKILKTELEGERKSLEKGIPIAKAREVIRDKTGISAEEFDRQLITCFRRGWLTLDFASPIGKDSPESLEVDGREYQIIRTFRRA